MRKIWDAIVRFLCRIPYDKLWHLIAGLIVAALLVIGFGLPGWAGLVGAIVAGVAKETFDYCTTKEVDGWDFVATSAGGVVILLLWLLHQALF
jgi:uncharacterized membrane protein YeaQ/YmgE (transglycosylase-associated protein family)